MRSLFLMVLIALSSNAVADNAYTCTKAGKARKINVVYKAADSQVPCEVQYTKPGSEPKVLWRANIEAGYCEKQAKAFAQKQRGFGWTCTEL